MSNYIRFPLNAMSLFVEVDAAEVAPPVGVEKAGLRDFVHGKADSVASAVERSSRMRSRRNLERVAQAMESAASRLARTPSEVEVTFGLKATGELGNIAIAKVGAEANFEVSLK